MKGNLVTGESVTGPTGLDKMNPSDIGDVGDPTQLELAQYYFSNGRDGVIYRNTRVVRCQLITRAETTCVSL